MRDRLLFADLFSGCGGLSYGFYHNKAFEGLLATDSWDKAEAVYRFNHPDIPFILKDLYDPTHVDDVVKLLSKRCDLLLGGPPCQGFSTLGKRAEKCKKSALVDTFAEIAFRVRPKIILMENVRGFVSKKHPDGGTYPEMLMKTLAGGSRGYDIWQGFINTIDYGLAQTRVRYFMLAVRKDINKKANLLKSIIESVNNAKSNTRLTLHDVIGDLPRIGPGEGAQELVIEHNKGKKIIIFNHQALNHSISLQKRLNYVPQGGGLLNVPRRLLTDHLKRMIDGNYGSGGHVKNIYGRLEWDKPCGTIVAGIDKITCGRYVHPEMNRLLTPRECAQIQSYPADFRFWGGLVVQYYLIGNSVPPKISEIFANAIEEGIGNN